MLVLTRRVGEAIVIGSDIRLTVLTMNGNSVRIGVVAPESVQVDREEVHRRRGEETLYRAEEEHPVWRCEAEGEVLAESRTTASAQELWALFEEAKGQWTGCAWPTHYGCLGLNLNGVRSSQAHATAARWAEIARGEMAYDNITTSDEAAIVEMAHHLRLKGAVVYYGEDQGCRLEVGGKPARVFCAGTLSEEWEFAAEWLADIESDAAWADQEARQAVDAAERGDWYGASLHVCKACLIESAYDGSRPWLGLRQMIQGRRRMCPV